jgi:hypothetical protein
VVGRATGRNVIADCRLQIAVGQFFATKGTKGTKLDTSLTAKPQSRKVFVCHEGHEGHEAGHV